MTAWQLCRIDIQLALAVKRLVESSGGQLSPHVFICPGCGQPLEAVGGPEPHFKHTLSSPACHEAGPATSEKQ